MNSSIVKSFSIFIIEKNSVEQIRDALSGRVVEVPNLNLSESDRVFTLESEQLSSKVEKLLKQIYINYDTTVLNVIKQYKGNLFNFNPFPCIENGYGYYIIEQGYILRRPQINNSFIEDLGKYNKKIIKEYYQQKIRNLGIGNNEILILDTVEVSRKKNRKYENVIIRKCMVFLSTTVDFFNMVYEYPKYDKSVLHMALLYTDADKELSCFLRETYSDIHILSGLNFKVYAIEKLNTNENFQEVLRYWRSLLSEKLYIVWAALGLLRTKPFDKTQCYEIGNGLGINPDQFPCIALFDIPSPERVLIFPILKPYIKFFRSLFKDLNEILKEFEDESMELELLYRLSIHTFAGKNSWDVKKYDQKIYDFVKKKYTVIREKLLENSMLESSAGVAKYVFNGKTFFVNFYTEEISMAENRNIHMGDKGNYIEHIERDYVQGNKYVDEEKR